jgi:hypothetical protein
MQQINLYTAEFHPQRQWLTAQHCVQLWGAILGIGLLIAMWQGWSSHRLSNEASTLQAQLTEEQRNFDSDQTQLSMRKLSPELSSELDHSNAEEAAKAQLLEALKAGALSGKQGYTRVLVGLARNTMEELWLTDIEIAAKDVNLKGLTRKADFVPVYINKIVNDSDFGPREYRSLKLETNDKGLLAFELRGHRDTGDKK